MTYQHGISILENPTSVTPPIETNSAIQVVIGTAPINLADDIVKAVNNPMLAYRFSEAVSGLGYSKDWEKYTLCQSMDASFKHLSVGPVIFINVLDPAVHKAEKVAQPLNLVAGKVKIDEFGILLSSVVIKSSDGLTTYVKDTDYTLGFNLDGIPVVAVIDGGSIGVATELQADYSVLDPDLVTDLDIIGGYDQATGKYTGVELIAQIFPRLGLIPGLLLAPGWSHKPVVGSILAAKSTKINEAFNCTSLLDIDSVAVTSYQDAPAWKSENSYTSKDSVVCYPKTKIGDKVYWYSAIMAATIARTDAQNENVPYVSPSNKKIPISGMVLGDNTTELYLDRTQANFLNGAGIVTAINMNGWRTWGNNTAAYPETTDPKDRFIAVRRVFSWWGNTFILTYSQKVDDPLKTRLIESVVDSENIRANGFQARGQIAGAHIEFRKEDNPDTAILNGKIKFIQKIGAFTPALNIVNVLEFDPNILSDSLFGGE
jgi:phage tail sheath protein FI